MKQKQEKQMRAAGKILFILYIIFLIYFLIFSDWYGRTGDTGGYHYNLILFQEIRRFWDNRETLGAFATFTNLFGNVLIFMPFGFFLPMGSRYKSFASTLTWTFGVSFGVEVFQLLTKVGSFDVDDLLLNTIGGVLGHIVFVAIYALRRKNVKRNDRRRNSGNKRKDSKNKNRIY